MPALFLGSDHRGLALKAALLPYLRAQGLEPVDVTPPVSQEDMIDYPLAAQAVAKKVAAEKGLGILLCGSGVGVAIAANRFKGVRAAVAHSIEEVETAKAHNHINVLCLSADQLSLEQMQELIQHWLSAEEDHVERRVRRIEQLDHYGS